jgi:hypothetical protein
MQFLQITRLLFAAASIAMLFASSSNVQAQYTSPSNLGPAQFPSYGIQYFGYGFLQTSDGVLDKNVLLETKSHSNAFFVSFDPTKPEALRDTYAQMAPDFKGIIEVSSIFIDGAGNFKTDAQIANGLDWLSYMLAWSMASNVAYFAFDEPMWKRQIWSCTGLGDVCTDNGPRLDIIGEMPRKIEGWAAQLRQRFPGKGIFYVESHKMIRDALTLPANMDLYAFDCYGEFDTCGFNKRINQNTGQLIVTQYFSNRQLFNILKEKVEALNNRYGGYRKMAIVPPTFLAWAAASSGTNSSLNYYPGMLLDAALSPIISPLPYDNKSPDVVALERAYRYIEEFKSEPIVALVGGFLWNTTSEGEGGNLFLGARGMPNTRWYSETVGRSITGKTTPEGVYASSLPIIEFTATPKLASNNKSIWAWASKNASSCRSITQEAAGIFQGQPPTGVLLSDAVIGQRVTYTIECSNSFGATRKTLDVTYR